MTIAMEAGVRRVATYERVSSEDQRERETIRTQRDELARVLADTPDVTLVERFVDDGVSGTIPLAERPAGSRLMRAAAARRFDELHVYKFDRLGRDAVDLLVVRRRFIELGIRVRSVVEGEPDLLGYDVQAVVADHARRDFLRRSADGMNRAAREGRYTGGIVAFGYRVEGHKQTARYVPDTAPLSEGLELSAADVVRQIYRRLAIDGWSCPRIAHELNALGVPTSYGRAGREVKRGERKERTEGIWRAGRVRNIVIEAKYKGSLAYGRRARKAREVIPASIEPLVSEALWQAAQDALHRNGRVARNTHRRYLLKGVIPCATCTLSYVGSRGRPDVTWYRCGGKQAERGPLEGRCPSPMLRGDEIERQVWADVERFLRNPGDALAELEVAVEGDAAIAEAERITLERALAALEGQRRKVLALTIRGRMSDVEADAEFNRIEAEKAALQARVGALDAQQGPEPSEGALSLLDELRGRLDVGLTDEQRQEIVRLLVKITVHTEPQTEGRTRSPRAVIEYRFPRFELGVLQTHTDTGSSPPRAGTARGR